MKRTLEIKVLGYIFIVFAILVGLLGFLTQRAFLDLGIILNALLQEYYANVSTEIISIAITVLIIDSIYERRDIDREKKNLILQLSSPNFETTQEATRLLRMRGWLSDGSLRNISLQYANLRKGLLWLSDLEGADFYFAKLTNARLEKSNLKDAKNLTDEQLVSVRNLRKTIMPNGSYYDGRYNLEGDFWLANNEQVDISDDVQMASFYGISLETYLNGQEWAQNNLDWIKQSELSQYFLYHGMDSAAIEKPDKRVDKKININVNLSVFLISILLIILELRKYFRKDRF
mgnify:CR=1 FL=1